MGRSLCEVYIHFIWTTKNRTPILRDLLEVFVHKKIHAFAKNHKVEVLACNSAWDHIHVLAKWHSTAAMADVVREWKSRVSNEWNDPDDDERGNLKWQSGSGMFSVSPHEVDRLVNYIANQKYHHSKKGQAIHRYERGYGSSGNRSAG